MCNDLVRPVGRIFRIDGIREICISLERLNRNLGLFQQDANHAYTNFIHKIYGPARVMTIVII